MTNDEFCIKPFKFFEIGSYGDCFLCCRIWQDNYCLGNIFEKSFDEIWNGTKATECRQSIIDDVYKFCDTKKCLKITGEKQESAVAPYPEEVSLCYDNTCVQQCVYCRDEPQIMSKEEQKKWDKLIEPVFIPMLKNAKLVTVNVAGEVFISNHSKKLIKRIAEVYPDIKFAIITNGILCSEENLNSLGIADKIHDIRISLPSCIESTYNKIVRNGNYKAVMENLNFVSKMKKQNKIAIFYINYVLSSLNYKDFIPMAKLAKELEADIVTLIVQNSGQNTKFLREIDKYLINEPTHPEFNNFIKIMNNPIIKDNPHIFINDSFKNLKPNSFSQVIKNKINFYKKYGLK